MEDTLRGSGGYSQRRPIRVLILVLMEDTLRDQTPRRQIHELRVLILVLMEDTLRGIVDSVPRSSTRS